MERRRLYHQRLKQQQQRFCVSQQDLTEAIARMKPITTDFQAQRRATHDNLTNLSSSVETLSNPPVSQLIKKFEARANITPYASAQDLLTINNDVISNGAESNCSHMSIRTLKIKGNDNDIINNNVCSPISSSVNDDNQMVIVEIHQQQHTEDKEQEIHQTLDNDRHKQNLTSSSNSSEKENNNHSTEMLTRSTDIDAAAASVLGKRHEIRFDELLTKEEQLNNALADLLLISNDIDKPSSINSSPRLLTHVSNAKTNNNTSISTSIELLNNLLQTFDHDNEDYDKKKKNEDNYVKPINMFW
jgi:hypothetical protein